MNPVIFKPPFYWAGGKAWMYQILAHYMPQLFGSIFLPFFGRGDFLRIIRSYGHDQHVYISDLNPRLVKAHLGMRNCTEEVVEILKQHRLLHSYDYYDSIRARYSPNMPLGMAAADFIFMMNAAFKGVLKETVDGYCTNVSARDAVSFNYEAIREHALTLKNTAIVQEDFAATLQHAKSGDLTFLDGPFADCLGYGAMRFTDADQMRLAHNCRLLDSRGVLFMAMNADHPFIRHLYRDFHIEVVTAPRVLGWARNSGKAQELIITNY